MENEMVVPEIQLVPVVPSTSGWTPQEEHEALLLLRECLDVVNPDEYELRLRIEAFLVLGTRCHNATIH